MAEQSNQNVTLCSKLIVSKDVLSQEIDGETVLLDLKGATYFGLDEVGTRAWQLLADQGSLRPVHVSMLEAYEVEGEKLEMDLIRLITQLVEAGLVSLDSGGASSS